MTGNLYTPAGEYLIHEDGTVCRQAWFIERWWHNLWSTADMIPVWLPVGERKAARIRAKYGWTGLIPRGQSR